MGGGRDLVSLYKTDPSCKDGSVTLRSICSFIDTKRWSDRQISNSGVEGNVDKTDS